MLSLEKEILVYILVGLNVMSMQDDITEYCLKSILQPKKKQSAFGASNGLPTSSCIKNQTEDEDPP